jgi:hypothetical protein
MSFEVPAQPPPPKEERKGVKRVDKILHLTQLVVSLSLRVSFQFNE